METISEIAKIPKEVRLRMRDMQRILDEHSKKQRILSEEEVRKIIAKGTE